ALDGQGLADREVAVDRDDLAVVQDQVRLIGPRGGAAKAERQEQAGKPRGGTRGRHGRDSPRSLPGDGPVPSRPPPSGTFTPIITDGPRSRHGPEFSPRSRSRRLL